MSFFLQHSSKRTQSKLEFIPPAFNPLVFKSAQFLLPIFLQFQIRRWLPTRITRIETANVEVLVNLYQQFQAGKVRFLMAFRHSAIEDALCMLYLLSQAVPRVARQKGIHLQNPVHTHFVYNGGISQWTDRWNGWLFSRLGGIPIYPGKRLDRIGLQTVRDLFANGKLPMAIAPEGFTNGHSEIISPLRHGVAQLGFWCLEDLLKAERSETVFIVPIGIQYHYEQPPWTRLDWLLSELEADTGLPVQPIENFSSVNERERIYYQRLFRIGEQMLSQMEQFYAQFYHKNLPTEAPSASEEPASPNEVLALRLQALLNVALQVAEEYFNLPAQGDLIERCLRLQQAFWDYTYRKDMQELDSLSPIEQGLTDWIAEEASLRIRHMLLVVSFVAVTGSYVQEKPTAERFAETALKLFDLIARIKSTKPRERPNLGQRWVQMTVGEPISVTERWQVNQRTNRQTAKQAVVELTQDLQIALENLIR